MVDFTVSSKPSLNSSSRLLIISVLYRSLAHNILGGKMTLEIFWFIPCLDWGEGGNSEEKDIFTSYSFLSLFLSSPLFLL